MSEQRNNAAARLSALEAQVSTLADLLGGTLATLGALNAHVGVMREPGDDLTAFRERLEDLEVEINSLYDKLDAIWPEIGP
jgi:hypothetical protein